MSEKETLEDIFYSIREIVTKINNDERIDTEHHTQLYMVAQEACYGLNESELINLKHACEDIINDRRN